MLRTVLRWGERVKSNNGKKMMSKKVWMGIIVGASSWDVLRFVPEAKATYRKR
jgi:hypothetical protein